ncbi:MAG: hypothetical protein Q9218_001531 [Villophora microphyllina]
MDTATNVWSSHPDVQTFKPTALRMAKAYGIRLYPVFERYSLETVQGIGAPIGFWPTSA